MAEHELVEAFPFGVRHEVAAMVRGLGMGDARSTHSRPPVVVGGESLWIPSRTYGPAPSMPAVLAQAPWRRSFAHLLLTTHHDGTVRERHAAAAARVVSPFAAPFVVQLAGDYVVEIVEAIRSALPELADCDSAYSRLYGAYFRENPDELDLVRQRTVSYWNEHHRGSIAREDYAGSKLVADFERAATHGSRAPRRPG